MHDGDKLLVLHVTAHRCSGITAALVSQFVAMMATPLAYGWSTLSSRETFLLGSREHRLRAEVLNRRDRAAAGVKTKKKKQPCTDLC